MSTPRIPLLSTETMSAEQRRVHDSIVGGRRGKIVGPLRAALHVPALAEPWSALGQHLRYGTILPPRVSELAILVTARRWTCQLEWWAHAPVAEDAGLPAAVIEAIRLGEPPPIEDADDALVYEFVRQLHQSGQPREALHAQVMARWGVEGVVELTALAGYYTLVAMTLNAHALAPPDQSAPQLAAISGSNGLIAPLQPVLVGDLP